MDSGLVYVGKIVAIEDIPGADFISAATAVCGPGGKWRGVVKKGQLSVEGKCTVFLPDSILPETPEFEFMRASKWRVRMRNFKGVPSEALIMPYNGPASIGKDITIASGVTKYFKPVPESLAGIIKGEFPSFLRKTDEPNWQKVPELLEELAGNPYYISEKCDGSSTTAYKWEGKFGVCSRNYELEESDRNGYWKVATKYNLDRTLPEGYALQWETCGPGIQKNPMGLKEIDGFAFSLWDIERQVYTPLHQLKSMCDNLLFPQAKVLEVGASFVNQDLTETAKGKYDNGKNREGVVVRSCFNINRKTISFKVINLDYEC